MRWRKASELHATELQQQPRCAFARAVFGAFRTSGAVVSSWESADVDDAARARGEHVHTSGCPACAFEAGRLAAIRAEVEREAEGLLRQLLHCQLGLAIGFWNHADMRGWNNVWHDNYRATDAALRGLQSDLARDYQAMSELRGRWQDVSRWLEATR